MTDDEIAAEILANYLRSNRDIAEHCGGRWFEIDGLAVKDTCLPVEGQNGAFVTRPLTDPAGTVRDAVRYFDESGRPYGILVPDEMDMAAEHACLDLGLVHARSHPGLALFPLPREQGRVSGLRR